MIKFLINDWQTFVLCRCLALTERLPQSPLSRSVFLVANHYHVRVRVGNKNCAIILNFSKKNRKQGKVAKQCRMVR